jgi:hypothetical protein
MSRNLCRFTAPLLAVAALVSTARAVDPSLSAIRPSGFQAGTEVEVSLTGARLGDAAELMFYSPGIEVVALNAEKDNLVKAKLAIAPQCRLGVHAVRLRSATGLSNLRTFTVGALPEIAESEPNNEFTSPQAVAADSTISGVVQNEDVDYFAIDARKGERITAELEGIRLGYTFFDPYLAILDAERFELARSDDAVLVRQDSLCSIIAPEDGKYIIQVRESAYGGNGSCIYRLHVGRFPRPRAVLPAGGRPGETLAVRWIGDAADDWTEEIQLPSTEDPAHALFARDQHGIAPSPNVIRVVDLQNTLENEPNNTREQATAAVAPGALNGVIEQPEDVDTFKFSAKKGQVFDIRVYARETLRSPLDSVLVVRRANGSAVGSNDDSGSPDSYLKFTAPEDEDYYVEVSDHLRAGGPNYVYRVEITPIQPALTISLPERVQYFSTTLAVPQANRMALMVNAARANWGGDLNVTFPGLPDGMSVQTVTMSANQTSIPVLFTASPDAAPGGALTHVIGRPVDEKYDFVGQLQQRTMLVRGQNNRDVWGHDSDRMAAAVTAEAPFEIEIVQPQAPIARSGSKQLKVVAKRKAGFTQPIAIRMLYNPPGIGSSGSISIPGDKNEAEIPLTANGNAATGTWPIIVTGSTKIDGGTLEVATQMAELTVSDSFVNLTLEKAAGELGGQAQVVVNVENKIEFEGQAQVSLLGLPANTTTDAEPKAITNDTENLIFPVAIGQDARPGVHKSLVCRVVVTQNGEPITHTLGSGELRVDKPLPPKAAAPAPAPKPEPAKTAPAEAAPKPLSRLEQLRLQKEQEEQSP